MVFFIIQSSNARGVPNPLAIEKITRGYQLSKGRPWIITQCCALVSFIVVEIKVLSLGKDSKNLRDKF